MDPQLARFDRVMHEARARKWRLATLNLIATTNTPATFHETPDVAGLNLADTASTPPAR
jgi:hypothetical protein